MSEVDVLPELKQIVGALLFVAKQPLKVSEIRRVLVQVAEIRGGATKDFAKATESDVKEAIGRLREDIRNARLGFNISEVASGFRLENDVNCGPWLRLMLDRGKPNRLTRPALETLAIIAYRQPCTRAEIEAVRGVAVDQIIRNLLELQLVRVTGRSELPGRPWLFGTTQRFMEHFGLNHLNDLPGVDELRRMEAEQLKKQKSESAAAAVPDEVVEGETVEGEAVEEEAEEPVTKESAEEETVDPEDSAQDEDVEEDLDDEDDEYEDDEDEEEDE